MTATRRSHRNCRVVLCPSTQIGANLGKNLSSIIANALFRSECLSTVLLLYIYPSAAICSATSPLRPSPPATTTTANSSPANKPFCHPHALPCLVSITRLLYGLNDLSLGGALATGTGGGGGAALPLPPFAPARRGASYDRERDRDRDCDPDADDVFLRTARARRGGERPLSRGIGERPRRGGEGEREGV